MRIAPGRVVLMEYSVRLADGEVVESTAGKGPVSYVHGGGQLLPALERLLEGMAEGQRSRFALEAGEAYGERNESNVVSLPRSMFPSEVELEPGLSLMARASGGQSYPVTVEAVVGDQVRLDLNHPLAGKRLFFEVAIHDVRPAASQEILRGRPQDLEVV